MIWYDVIFIYCNWVPTRWTKIGTSQLHTKGETTHKTIQKHRIHKIENKHTKQENKHEKNNKNISLVIRNYKEQQIIMRTRKYTEPIHEW